jgi:hypothetical protein
MTAAPKRKNEYSRQRNSPEIWTFQQKTFFPPTDVKKESPEISAAVKGYVI